MFLLVLLFIPIFGAFDTSILRMLGTGDHSFSIHSVVQTSKNDTTFIIAGNMVDSNYEGGPFFALIHYDSKREVPTEITPSDNAVSVIWAKWICSLGYSNNNDNIKIIESEIEPDYFYSVSMLYPHISSSIEIVISKFDSSGKINKTISIGSGVYVYSIIEERIAGDLLLIGFTFYEPNSNHDEILVLKISSNLTTILQKYLYGSLSEIEWGKDIIQLKQNGNSDLMIVGESRDDDGDFNIVLCRINISSGQIVWKKKFGCCDVWYSFEVIIPGKVLLESSQDGNIIIAGSANCEDGYDCILLTKFHVNNGDLIWMKTLGGLYGGYNKMENYKFLQPKSIKELDDGKLVVVGRNYYNDYYSSQLILAKFSSDGDCLLMSSTFKNDDSVTFANDFFINEDGSFTVVGQAADTHDDLILYGFFGIYSDDFESCVVEHLISDVNYFEKSYSGLFFDMTEFVTKEYPDDDYPISVTVIPEENVLDLLDFSVYQSYCVFCFDSILRTNENEEEICNNHGFCNSFGLCTCEERWGDNEEGLNCTEYDEGPYCDGIRFDDEYYSDELCNYRGTCTGEDYCTCNVEWKHPSIEETNTCEYDYDYNDGYYDDDNDDDEEEDRDLGEEI